MTDDKINIKTEEELDQMIGDIQDPAEKKKKLAELGYTPVPQKLMKQVMKKMAKDKNIKLVDVEHGFTDKQKAIRKKKNKIANKSRKKNRK